jgi:hypothetical protein
LCRPDCSSCGSGLCRLLLGYGHGKLARDLGLLGLQRHLGLVCGVGKRCLLVGGCLILCLLLLERGPLGTQAVLVDMKRIDGECDITTCHFFVLRSRKPSVLVLVALEQGLSPIDVRIHVDVGPDRFRPEPTVIAAHSIDVGLDLILSRGNLRLVPLDLGNVDVVLLLVGADLELLQHEILGDLARLCSEVGHLVGCDGSKRHDHRCGDHGYERQANRPRSNTGEPSHSPPET